MATQQEPARHIRVNCN